MKRILKIFLFIFFIFSPNVWANEVLVKNYKLQNNIDMNGIYSKYNFNFYVNENWKVTDDSYIYLNVNISDMIKYKNSVITVYLNNLPIGSIELYGQKNIQKAIPLQVKKIKTGFNNIKIAAFKMIDTEDRFEEINIGNYIELLADSYVHIEYIEMDLEPFLNNFPYPFLKLGHENKFETVILTANDKDAYLAMLYLSATLGKYDAYSNLNLNVKHIKDFNGDDVDKNIIILASYWDLDGKTRQVINDDEKAKMANNALVKIIKSPYNEKKYMLLVTSFDNKKIIEAAKTLGDIEFIKDVDSNKLFVSEYKMPKEQEKKIKFTLKDLGFNDITLNLFENDLNFMVEIPKEESLKDDAYIELNFRYSKLLDFNKSSICVYINGVPYQDKKLSEKNSTLDSFRVSFRDLKDISKLNIGVKFNLVSKTKEEVYLQEDLFAVLLNSSYVYIPTKHEKRRDLKYYPAPFVENGKFNNLNLVILDNLDNNDLTSLSNIFAFLGHSINTLDGLYLDKTIDKTKNNLLYAPSQFENMKDIFKVFIENGIYKVKDELNISLNDDDAVIEISDGFLENTFVAAFLVTDKTKIKNIERYLSDFDFVERISGDVCLINSRGAVKCYELNKRNIVDNNKRLLLLLSVTSAIIVLILLIFVAIRFKE